MDLKRTLQARDQHVIWHPFSQHGLHEEILPVASAKGAYLTLEDGRQVIDAISSWWVNIHGHSNARIADAIYKQAQSMEHVIFAGFTHQPAVKLAEQLVKMCRDRNMKLSRCFYSDNGSTAVEVALKMAFQFHFNRGDSKRTRFLALNQAYHGDTLGAMAVGEPDGFHRLFKPLLPEVDFVGPDQMDEFERKVENDGDSIAAFIFEPIVQGASGMKMYSPQFLRDAVALCKEKGILTIADEVFTGFYRTGKWLASEYAEIEPDLLCLSKGITGGFLPLAVTLATEEVYSGFLSKQLSTAFLHGHSYTANPLACAAALESCKMLEEPSCIENRTRIANVTEKRIRALGNHSQVKFARSLGTIGAIELKKEMSYFDGGRGRLIQRALEKGVLLRPLGNVIYTVPPYCVTEGELNQIYETMEELAHGKF